MSQFSVQCRAFVVAIVAGAAGASGHAGGWCGPAACLGDLDGNQQIDGGDLGVLLGAWGPGFSAADLDDNGAVDGGDLGVLLGAWGACPQGVACPASSHACTVAGSAGCTDGECCSSTCAADAYCCTVEWDSSCVALAVSICLGVNHCCGPLASPGCADQACADLVCGLGLSYCCETQWDATCAEVAVGYCFSCTALMTVSDVSPPSADQGGIITIEGANFPADADQLSIAAVDESGAVVALRALSATDNTITAEVGEVPPGFGAARIVVVPGTGFTTSDIELPPGVELDSPGAWVWQEAGAAAHSEQCISLVPSADDGCLDLAASIEDGVLSIAVPQAVLELGDEGDGGVAACKT